MVSDVRMPGMDGPRLAAAIRALRQGSGPPVILLSSLGERLDEATVAGSDQQTGETGRVA